jgi:hypothetical protein
VQQKRLSAVFTFPEPLLHCGAVLTAGSCGHLRQNRIQVKRSGLLTRRELGEVRDLARDHRLHQVHLRHVISEPVHVGVRVELGPLERVAAQVHDVGHSKLHKRLHPHSIRVSTLLRQVELIVFRAIQKAKAELENEIGAIVGTAAEDERKSVGSVTEAVDEQIAEAS